MARDGYKILDSDMHVFEPYDLYEKYMEAKWGERIPRGKPRTKHGQIKFTYSDGRLLRPSGTQALAATAPKPNNGESAPGETRVAHRYAKPLARDYDAVSQLAAMDDEVNAHLRFVRVRSPRDVRALLASGLVADGFGQLLGYVAGGGVSPRYLTGFEFRRVDHVPESDRYLWLDAGTQA